MATMRNSSFLLYALTSLGAAFGIGYWLGQESILTVVDNNAVQVQFASNQQHGNANRYAWLDKAKQQNDNKPQNETNLNEDSDSIENKVAIDIGSPFLPSNPSPTELLEFLVLITTSDDPSHMDQFSSTMDQLRELVASSPENIEMLLDYFVNSPLDAREPYYITSVLQSANIENREQVLAGLVERLALQGSPEADEKMLQLVSNTGLVSKQAEVVDAVMNIALYGDAEHPNKLFALDLLMPYQLDLNQKQKVVDDLSFALSTSSEDDKSYLVENIMRYSDKSQRQQMASDYLQQENDFSARVAILSSIHSGSVRPTDTLKKQLFTIAQNANDPLRDHAKHALMYAFEIDNSEYQVLSGK